MKRKHLWKKGTALLLTLGMLSTSVPVTTFAEEAAGDGDANNYEHIVYEGYGPNGTAIIVKTLTDNKNRTASNVRNAFTKGSGNVGTPGCVSFMFDKKGQIIIDK